MNILFSFLLLYSYSANNKLNISIEGDSIKLNHISPNFKTMFEANDTVVVETIEVEDLLTNWIVLDWDLLQSGASIIKLSDSTFLLKCYSNLPFNGIDSNYSRIDVIHFFIHYQSGNSGYIQLDTAFKPNLNWNNEKIQATKQLWADLSVNNAFRKKINELTYQQCGEILNLNYGLMYSILAGDITCVKYFQDLELYFPAITELTLGEEYRSTVKVLKYYKLL